MEYPETQITLKNGAGCVLRSPTSQDAAGILEHMRLTSAQTDFMARYADEISMTPQQEAKFLEDTLHSKGAVMVCAIMDGEIAANAGFNPVGPMERCRHRCELGISVKRAYWGIGVGSAVMHAVLKAARTAGYEQVELDVVASNTRAIALYKKLGFVRYGTRENAYHYRDGHREALDLMLLRL